MPYKFKWEGSSEPSVKSGCAMFVFGEHVVRVSMNEFKTAHDLDNLIRAAIEYTEDSTLKQTTGRIQEIAKRIGRGEL